MFQKKNENESALSLRELLGDRARDFLVCVLDQIDSTNTEAKRRALDTSISPSDSNISSGKWK